jgi:anti-anti-sigma regulatory factor
MNIVSGPFKVADQEKECYKIKITGHFTGNSVTALRDEIDTCVSSDYDTVYIDVKEVTEADLSGINEVINAHYTLEKNSRKLVFVYEKGTSIEDWVETTGLDKFVATAIVPPE